MSHKTITDQLIQWFKTHGRHDLPWQSAPTPYRVWVSEIMLQQTQVSTVIPYYLRFMARFPSMADLANASLDDVLSHWSGLGYYARARHLHATAKILSNDHNGKWPCDIVSLCHLPGIGRSTAGAIASFAMNQPTAILDGNVKRVLARVYGQRGWPGHTQVLNTLWQLAELNTPRQNTHIYNQAIMDLGALICTRRQPTCTDCPVNEMCFAYQSNTIDAFPEKKPKKEKPKKSIYMLLATQPNNQLLLIKRPLSGLWGGLWCLPEATDLRDIEKQFNISVSKYSRLPSFDHHFTHYSLTIYPIHYEVDPSTHITCALPNQETVWYTLGTALPGGIPKPTQQLIKQLEEQL